MSGTSRHILKLRQGRLLEYLESKGYLRSPVAPPSAEDTYGVDFTMDKARSGAATLLAGERLVHSRMDPEREAQKAAAGIGGKANDGGPIVILGLGLGYSALAAAVAYPERPIVVAELDPRILALALATNDLTPLIDRDRVAFVCGGAPSAILAALGTFPGEPEILPNRALCDLAPSWYGPVSEAVMAHGSRERTNRATFARFGRRWARNLMANARAIDALPCVQDLQGLGRGKSALVIAAGPSLDDLMPRLPELAARTVVIAVDTAARALLGRGITPDFIVSADPQYWNYLHIAGLEAKASTLVADTASYPPALRGPFRNRALFSSRIPLARFIEERVRGKGTLAAGGSVATSAWGVSVIYMAGLDLGYPEGRTHFRGALFEERSHCGSGRFKSAETDSVAARLGANPAWGLSFSGSPLQTDPRLTLYAAWFEARLAIPGIPPTKCLSDAGLAIRGMECCGEEELLALPILDEGTRSQFRSQVDRALHPGAPKGGSAGATDLPGTVVGSCRELVDGLAGLEESLAAERRAWDAGKGDMARLRALAQPPTEAMAGHLAAAILSPLNMDRQYIGTAQGDTRMLDALDAARRECRRLAQLIVLGTASPERGSAPQALSAKDRRG